MRAHICWLYFKKDADKTLIRNNENNENWPNILKFSDLMKEWTDTDGQYISLQLKHSNEIEIENNKTRQLMADVQAWFINEYNLLNKPAKRVFLEKQKELKILEHELKVHQYNLDNPKEKLEEFEKQCLLKKIEIQKKKNWQL